MTEIRHIVFDVGKVLVHYDPHQAYSDLIAGPAERETFPARRLLAANGTWSRTAADPGKRRKRRRSAAIPTRPS